MSFLAAMAACMSSNHQLGIVTPVPRVAIGREYACLAHTGCNSAMSALTAVTQCVTEWGMESIHGQLHAAWQASDLTLRELLDRSQLSLTIVSLSRKLRGLQVMSTSEASALAHALGVVVSTSTHETTAPVAG